MSWIDDSVYQGDRQTRQLGCEGAAGSTAESHFVLSLLSAWTPSLYVRGAIVFDFATFVRSITLASVLGTLPIRSWRFEWVAASVVTGLGIARLSTQMVR